MIAVDVDVLSALVRSYLGGRVEIPEAVIADLEDALPVALGRISPAELSDRLALGLAKSPGPAVTGASGRFSGPADVDFAVDTIRGLRRGAVSPAESVDLDRVLSILRAVRG